MCGCGAKKTTQVITTQQAEDSKAGTGSSQSSG